MKKLRLPAISLLCMLAIGCKSNPSAYVSDKGWGSPVQQAWSMQKHRKVLVDAEAAVADGNDHPSYQIDLYHSNLAMGKYQKALDALSRYSKANQSMYATSVGLAYAVYPETKLFGEEKGSKTASAASVFPYLVGSSEPVVNIMLRDMWREKGLTTLLVQHLKPSGVFNRMFAIIEMDANLEAQRIFSVQAPPMVSKAMKLAKNERAVTVDLYEKDKHYTYQITPMKKKPDYKTARQWLMDAYNGKMKPVSSYTPAKDGEKAKISLH